MKEAPITKEEFIDIISLLRKQFEKDMEFGRFMETYLDGRFVPQISDYATTAAMKALALAFGDRVTDKYGMTWIDWFSYECDWGDKPMTATLDKVEYVIDSPEKFYDFLIKWYNSDGKQSADQVE